MVRKVYTDTNDFLQQSSALETGLPFSESTDILTTSLTVGSKTISNRLACQAMEGCDGNPDGTPGELTLRRYDRFSEGGAGLIWYEATAVMEEGKANPRQLHINADNVDAFASQVERIKENALKKTGKEPVVIMQATHSGRYSKPEGAPAPLIAYNNPIFEKDSPIDKSRIVTDEHIDRIKEALISASALAEKAGFDGVDIKACHRYLNCELLSAFTREGRYGGSFENRTRLLREGILGAMEVTGKDFIVTSRMNVYDGFPYPWGFGVNENDGIKMDLREPVRLIEMLYSYGVKILNITMGNPYFNPHVNRPFAKGGYTHEEHPLQGVARMLHGISEIKHAVPDMKIISSALSYLGVAAPNVAAGFISEGGFDMAGFGRTIFAYPDFANDIINKGCFDKNKICICCSKCTEIMRTPGGTPGCVIRDKDVYAPIYIKQCAGD